MVMFIRLGLSTIVGVVVTLGLFYLMQYLIQGADSALTDDKIGNLVDFVRVKQDQQLESIGIKKEKKKLKELKNTILRYGFLCLISQES